MPALEAPDSGFEKRVSESFSRLTLMSTIGARLVKVAAGAVEIDMPVRDELTQQHGYVAAAVVTPWWIRRAATPR
jgi:acyl-coenzyme A thioesterase PaaI-like protein